METLLFWLAPISSIAALITAYIFFKIMIKKDEGNETMKKIAEYVRRGALAYLKQQYKVVALFFVVLTLLFSILAYGFNYQNPWVPFAFLTGGFFSGLAGFFGMKTATYASSRVAQAARDSLNSALQIAFRSGAVMGLVVVGLGLLDISLWFLILKQFYPLTDDGHNLIIITTTMLTFGMGASTQALFARVGGGIYTKAADVGADLVGKVEAGIPEDDPRNPATIADNVGDNVGDVAGMGADLYESYCGSILATAALGASAFFEKPELQLKAVIAPLLVAAIGIILSIVGIISVRTKEDATQKDLLKALSRGINLSSLFIIIFSYLIIVVLLNLDNALGIWSSIVIGLIAGIIIGKSTEYYTSHSYEPTRKISESAQTGPATVLISGLGLGMISTAIPVLVVAISIVLAFLFSANFDFKNFSYGLYGIGFAAVGMLSTLGITLATDAYGPIADNAGGNAEMSKLGSEVRKRTDALDALGNTTAATGKGFAIGSAALTALALLASYIEEVKIGMIRIGQTIMDLGNTTAATGKGFAIGSAALTALALLASYIEEVKIGMIRIGQNIMDLGNGIQKQVNQASLEDFMVYYHVDLMNPKVVVGFMIGSMMAFLFCGLTMRAVGRAASRMVDEVRRQFKEIPGILEGKAEPDYARCVEISTKGAQKEMTLPASLAIIVPIFIGVTFGVPGTLGLLIGGLSTGFTLAIFMANAGGSWDNAKKYIEEGHFGGKGSTAHKAAVIGDTVGDPFKDTSGPSLNILIKLMSMVSIVMSGLAAAFSIL